VNHDTQKNPYEQEVKVERKEQGFRSAGRIMLLRRPKLRDVKFYMEAKNRTERLPRPTIIFRSSATDGQPDADCRPF